MDLNYSFSKNQLEHIQELTNNNIDLINLIKNYRKPMLYAKTSSLISEEKAISEAKGDNNINKTGLDDHTVSSSERNLEILYTKVKLENNELKEQNKTLQAQIERLQSQSAVQQNTTAANRSSIFTTAVRRY